VKGEQDVDTGGEIGSLFCSRASQTGSVNTVGKKEGSGYLAIGRDPVKETRERNNAEKMLHSS